MTTKSIVLDVQVMLEVLAPLPAIAAGLGGGLPSTPIVSCKQPAS